MSEKIENATSFPEVYIGLHMLPGVAEYRPPGAEPLRVFLNENTIRTMDPGFRGKPLYVGHVDKVDVRDIEKADGYVIESFYEPLDGKHWARFLVVSDRAKEAIRQGQKLSNAYFIKLEGAGGMWNGLDYDKEVLSAEYEHLAIVPDPRYAESVIFTPEQFAEYKKKKELELAKVANSMEPSEEHKGESMAFWKKTKVENSVDLESTMVDLPKSKAQTDLKTLINEMDDYRLKMSLPQMANDDHMVEVGDGDMKKKMNVKELKDCYNGMMAEKMKVEKEEEMKKNAEAEDEEKKKKENDAEAEERGAVKEEKKEEMKADGGESGKDKAKNAEAEDEEKKKLEIKKNAREEEAKKLFNELNNAHLKPFKDEVKPDLSFDRMARGKTRYGSI